MTSILRHLPNTISVLRLLLVAPISIVIVNEQYLLAFLLFAFAGLSDGLDGFIARRYEWVSLFGKILDPLADKLLLLVTTATLAMEGHFPLVVFLLMVTKDVCILGGIGVYSLLAGFPEMRPIRIGKTTTLLQIVLTGCIMVTLVTSGLPWVSELVPWLVWAVILVTIADGMTYLWIWTEKLEKDSRWRRSPPT